MPYKVALQIPLRDSSGTPPKILFEIFSVIPSKFFLMSPIAQPFLHAVQAGTASMLNQTINFSKDFVMISSKYSTRKSSPKDSFWNSFGDSSNNSLKHCIVNFSKDSIWSFSKVCFRNSPKIFLDFATETPPKVPWKT